MKKILLLAICGAFFTVATPAVAKAEVKAHIHINPFAWIFPRPRVVKVVQPRYRVVEEVRYYQTRPRYQYRQNRPYYKRSKKFKKRHNKRRYTRNHYRY